MVRWPSFGSVDATRRTGLLAVGDALAIAAFVTAGEIRHGGTLSSGLLTYGQFLAGWFVVAVAIGAYAPDAIDSRSRAAVIGFAGWVGGALLGQLIRAWIKPGFYVAESFVLVSIAFGGIAVVAWRVLATRVLDG